MVGTRENENHRISLRVKVNVFDINESPFHLKISHECRTVWVSHRYLDWHLFNRSPRPPHVVRLNKVEVCADIHFAIGVHVKCRADAVSASATDLVMPAHTSQLLMCPPAAAIRACVPVKFSHTSIFREEVEKPFALNPPRLRVGHLLFSDLLKGFNAVRLNATILESGAAPAPSTHEYPNISILIKGDA